MNKISFHEIEAIAYESPKKQFTTIERSVTKALDLCNDRTNRPFEMEHVTVLPGKKAHTYHAHGAQWELYWIIKGSARMRFDEGFVELEAGDAVQCPPGVAHQLLNARDAELEYWIISSNPDFDTCYYPDSDKVSVHPSFRANKEGLTRWTRVSEGGTGDYWQGEE